MQAALQLFLRQGYHATTIRQIAGAAGIVPGAVYNHFTGKEAIYLALLHEAGVYAAIGRALAAASGDSVETLMRDGAYRLLAALKAHSEVMPLLFVDVLEFETRNVVALAAEALPHIVSFFSRLAALGAETGELKPVRPDVLARAFLGLFVSYFFTVRFFSRVVGQFPGLDVNADVVDDFLNILAHGVLRSADNKE